MLYRNLSLQLAVAMALFLPVAAEALPSAPARLPEALTIDPLVQPAATVRRINRPALRPAVKPARRPVVGRPLPSHRPGFRPNRPIVVVRPWVPKRHFGRVIAGVVLGTVVFAAVAGSVPAPPAPNLCWYWTDNSQTRGYWDYCQ